MSSFRLLSFLVSLLAFQTSLLCETEDRTLDILRTYHIEITKAAERFQVPSRLLVSAIYADRRLYYNALDASLDVPIARQGRDNSIGIAQLRVSAAAWICKVLTDPEDPYYPSENTAQWIPRATDRDSLIIYLNRPTLNLLFAAAYSAAILQRWRRAGYDISNNAEVFATLYNLGPFRRDGTERVPHGRPRGNYFGSIAGEFYHSSLLESEFPRKTQKGR